MREKSHEDIKGKLEKEIEKRNLSAQPGSNNQCTKLFLCLGQEAAAILNL
jgi:hypothetical protein